MNTMSQKSHSRDHDHQDSNFIVISCLTRGSQRSAGTSPLLEQIVKAATFPLSLLDSLSCAHSANAVVWSEKCLRLSFGVNLQSKPVSSIVTPPKD